MHDFPLDIEDFDALSLQHSPSLLSTFHAVSSPSAADLTSNEVTFTWSSDDIPLVLYDDGYVHSPSSWDTSFSSSTGSGTQRNAVSSEMFTSSGSCISPQPRSEAGHPQAMSLHSRADRTPGVPRSAASSFLDLASLRLSVSSSDSSATITSVGTFGQGKNSDYSGSPPAHHGKDDPMIDEESVFRGRMSAAQPPAGLFAKATLSPAAKPAPLHLASRSQPKEGQSLLRSPNFLETCEEQDILYDDEYEDEEEPETPTPMKSVPNSISWVSSRDLNSQQYKAYMALQGLARSPMPQSPDVHTDGEDCQASKRIKLESKSPLRSLDMNASPDTPKASRFTAISPVSKVINKEQSVQIYHPHPSHVKPTIQQEHYAWLKDITIQFLIDQEGFRSARPNFKFTGVARLRSAHGTKAPGALMAQFRPITREAFHFHYAPFESPPVLRRVTVDFDEMHDYLTRQAHLTLKSNGVYVLHGHETSTISHETEPVKLHWRLEYLVDDRRVEGTRKAIEGEKVLTPLTFSCTPALVLSSQGKRNTVMHVFKKGVAPKLIAEKMQPPGTAHPTNKSTPTNSPAEHHTSKFFSSKVHTWSLHKRVQSHSPRAQAEESSHLRPHLPIPWTGHTNQQYRGQENVRTESPHVRRRRASSAGENQRTPPFRPVSPALDGHEVSRNATPLSRRILSPTKLAEILDTPFSPTVSVTSATPPRSSTTFTPLTPRPRHSPHLKESSYTR